LIPEYSDVIREAADALKEALYYKRAMIFYKALQDDPEYDFDLRCYIDLGQCYRYQGAFDDAETCLRAAISMNQYDEEALEALLKMFKSLNALEEASLIRTEIASRRRKKAMAAKDEQKRQLQTNADPDIPMVSVEEQMEDNEAFDARMLVAPINPIREPSPTTANRNKDPKSRAKVYDALKHDLTPIFESLTALEVSFSLGNRDSQLKWLDTARDAIEHFQAYKLFWPYEANEKFLGYKGHAGIAGTRFDEAPDQPSGCISTPTILLSELTLTSSKSGGRC
jgi:tetratricopeptide (TPR) repeat protein